MTGVRTDFANGRYVVGENDCVAGAVKTDLHTQTRGIIYCHGSGGNANDVVTGDRFFIDMVGKRASIHIGDLGLQTWGSDLVVTRIGQARDILLGLGVTHLGLYGVSMGGLSALNYAVRFPSYIDCVGLAIPATDLASLRSNPYLASRWPEIDAIYGAPPGANYTDHSPILFADDLDPEMPIKLWYSTDDPLVYPSTIDAFLAARPQTEAVSVGAASHSVPRSFYPSIKYFFDRNLPS